MFLREGERTAKPCTDDSSLFHSLLPEDARLAALLFVLSAFLLDSQYMRVIWHVTSRVPWTCVFKT